MTFTPFQGLISKALDHMSPTSNITDALQLIRNHWGLVWRRPDIDFPHASAAIDREISHLPQVGLAFEWSSLTHWQLYEKTVKMCNKGQENQ